MTIKFKDKNSISSGTQKKIELLFFDLNDKNETDINQKNNSKQSPVFDGEKRGIKIMEKRFNFMKKFLKPNNTMDNIDEKDNEESQIDNSKLDN